MIVQLKADNKNIVFLDGSEEINANDDFVQSLIVLLETPLNANARLSVVFFNEESVTYELDMLVRNRQNDSCIVDIPQALINSGGAWNLKLLRHRQAYTGEKTTASNDYPFTVGAGVKNINGENVTTAELQTAYNEIVQTRDEAQSLANTAGAAAASAQSAAETARQSSLGASSAANYAETKATQATTAASEAAQSATDAEQSRATAAQILNTTDKLKSQAEKAASDADDAVNYINTTLRDVSKAKAFDDYGALVNHLLTAQLDIPYAIGQPFYLIATSVPDLWVSGVLADYAPYEYTTTEKFLADMDANGGKVRVGNYQLSKLETAKITIDSAQEKYDENLETEDKTVVGAINELNEKKVGFNDYPTASKAGVIKYEGNQFGIYLTGDGVIKTEPATEAEILAKVNIYKPITPRRLSYAVKVGITTNTETLTDEEKASACEWVGAVKKDASVATNLSPLVYTNDTAKNHYLATNYRDYVAYNIPMLYGAASGKDVVTAYLLTATPVNDYHAANKKYVDDGFVPKPTSTAYGSYIIPYVVSTQGQRGDIGDIIKIEIGNGANTIARRGVNGTLEVGTPTSGLHAANKKYVDDGFVAKPVSSGVVRFNATDGTSTAYPIYQSVPPTNGNAIPLCKAKGRLVVGTPVENEEAATKGYVDSNIRVLTRITTGTSTATGSAYVNCKKADVVSDYSGVVAYLQKIGATSQNAGIPFAVGTSIQSLWVEPNAPILHIGTQDVSKTPTWEIVDN